MKRLTGLTFLAKLQTEQRSEFSLDQCSSAALDESPSMEHSAVVSFGLKLDTRKAENNAVPHQFSLQIEGQLRQNAAC